jgi:hypothetical protein
MKGTTKFKPQEKVAMTAAAMPMAMDAVMRRTIIPEDRDYRDVVQS